MDITVVIPAFNRADLISETIEAILAQIYPAHEIIVVDDGSTDATVEMAARYAPKVSIIRTKNAGSIVARNVGLRAATGKFVAFCDSDDLWRPEFLDVMRQVWDVAPATRTAYCDFTLVQDGAWGTDSKFASAPAGFWSGVQMVAPAIGIFNKPVVDRLIQYQPFFASCLIAERDALIAAGGWDEGVGRIVGDDFGTALRLAALPPIAAVFSTLAGIRKHGGNFSGNNRAVALGDSLVLEHVLRTRPEIASHRSLILESIGERRLGALHLAFAELDFAAVREIYDLLPNHMRSENIRLKTGIASLPGPLREIVARIALHLAQATRRSSRAGNLPHRLPDDAPSPTDGLSSKGRQ